MRETRNSRNQFVPGVFHFDLPAVFRDPVFRPSRTVHVAFDRTLYGTVRGQPIRPVLGGFGEPFTDWVFQAAMNARTGESTFALRMPDGWEHGGGWLLVYALRWMGRARRLTAPDSLAVVFVPTNGEPEVLTAKDAAVLLKTDGAAASTDAPLPPDREMAARRCAQQVLRESVAARGGQSRSTAGLSLLMVAKIERPYYGDSRMESINHEKRTMFSMVWCIILYPILLSP